jgi:hypothetical protein
VKGGGRSYLPALLALLTPEVHGEIDWSTPRPAQLEGNEAKLDKSVSEGRDYRPVVAAQSCVQGRSTASP